MTTNKGLEVSDQSITSCVQLEQAKFIPGTVCVGKYDFPGKAPHVRKCNY